MLHAKFQDHRTSGSGGITFRSPFPRRIYMKFGFDWPSRLDHRTSGSGGITFRSPFPRRIYMKFDFDWPSGFREEDV